jgi:hypothetical protein
MHLREDSRAFAGLAFTIALNRAKKLVTRGGD